MPFKGLMARTSFFVLSTFDVLLTFYGISHSLFLLSFLTACQKSA